MIWIWKGDKNLNPLLSFAAFGTSENVMKTCNAPKIQSLKQASDMKMKTRRLWDSVSLGFIILSQMKSYTQVMKCMSEFAYIVTSTQYCSTKF